MLFNNILTIALAITPAPQSIAAFTPEPTAPPVITNSSGTRFASDMPIAIPNPPLTRSTGGGRTYEQCLNQVSNMRIARQQEGMGREKSARIWVKQVDQCKAYPKAKKGRVQVAIAGKLA